MSKLQTIFLLCVFGFFGENTPKGWANNNIRINNFKPASAVGALTVKSLAKIFPSKQLRYKVALCITATGRYIEFIDRLVDSARHYFLTNHKVAYIVFTDSKNNFEANDVTFVYQKKLGWPLDTCCRARFYLACPLLLSFDYAFACDADMVFVDKCGDEILSDLVGVLHAGYLTKRGAYEHNVRSVAYVCPNEGTHYFAGGMYGGKLQEFLKVNRYLSDSLDMDLQNDLIAVWHDESYLNRYFIDNPPTLILSSSYCYPEPPITYPGLNTAPILIALNKNHAEYRK